MIEQQLRNVIDYLASINGIGQLWAQDGQFLGLLSSNAYDTNSIINRNTYGNQFYLTSVLNQSGLYGGACGMYSPYNQCCLQPPVIIVQGQPVLLITQNSCLPPNGLTVVDPDLIFMVYAKLFEQQNTVNTQLQNLQHSRMIATQMIHNNNQTLANLL